MAAKLNGNPERLSVPDYVFALGESRLQGSANIEFADALTISGEATATKLAYTDLPASEKRDAKTTAKTAKKNDRMFSRKPFSFSVPTDLNIDYRLFIDQLALDPAAPSLSNMQINLALKDGHATVRLAAKENENVLSANVELANVQQGVAITTTAKIRRFALEQVSRLLRSRLRRAGADLVGDLFGGPLYGKVRLTAVGGSAHELAASSNGQIEFAIDGGFVNGTVVEVVGTDIGETFASIAAGHPRTKIVCGLIRLEIKDGFLKTDPALIATADTNIRIKGNANLETEKLDFEIVPYAKDFSILTGAVPIVISGKLAKPKIRPAAQLVVKAGVGAALTAAAGPAALALPFIETGLVADENLCGEYVGAIRRLRSEAKPAH